MFQRILLVWRHDEPPTRSLEIAQSLAEEYDAELVICCVGNGEIEAQAAVGSETLIESLPLRHGGRELLRYAHAHAFDLLVVGRVHANEREPRDLIEWASLPVLVVAEEQAR
jgi:hypothetical protein